jgi:hypothetical protein
MSTPDRNYVSFADKQVGAVLFTELVPPPVAPGEQRWADTLKFSNAQDGTITGRKIVGGYEDCVDCNRNAADLDIHFDEWHSGGLYVSTIKGGSHDIRLSGEIVVRGSETDIDLGNGSDQSNERAKRITLNLTARDGQPVRVRVLNAWEPIFENGARGYIVNDRWKGVFVYVWRILHRLRLV